MNEDDLPEIKMTDTREPKQETEEVCNLQSLNTRLRCKWAPPPNKHQKTEILVKL